MTDDSSMRSSDRKIRVLTVDDSRAFRSELGLLLESEGNIQVVGIAKDGWEAIQQVERLRPAVVLMDQNMPGLSGVEATVRIKRRHPHIHIFFVTAETMARRQALRAGAEGFFAKGGDMDALLQALQAIRAPVARKKPLPRPSLRERAPLAGSLRLGALSALALIAIVIGLLAYPASFSASIALAFGVLFLLYLYALKY
ncbi:MAG: response regulator transcription factor [Chloroflexi bacterium]|nr:response regulator transcription factor [Chloroflexota bacterium]